MCLLYSMSATLDAVKLFTAAAAAAKSTTYKDKVYKCVWDKAQLYVDQQELPSSWDCAQLLGNMDLGDSDEVCWLLILAVTDAVNFSVLGCWSSVQSVN